MIKTGKSYSYWLARFNRKMSFHFLWVDPLISDRSVWHNGKQPCTFPRVFDLSDRTWYLSCSICDAPYVELEREIKKHIVLLLKSELCRV